MIQVNIKMINCDDCHYVKMCSHQYKENKCDGKMFKPVSIEKKIEVIRQYDGYKKEDEKQ